MWQSVDAHKFGEHEKLNGSNDIESLFIKYGKCIHKWNNILQ